MSRIVKPLRQVELFGKTYPLAQPGQCSGEFGRHMCAQGNQGYSSIILPWDAVRGTLKVFHSDVYDTHPSTTNAAASSDTLQVEGVERDVRAGVRYLADVEDCGLVVHEGNVVGFYSQSAYFHREMVEVLGIGRGGALPYEPERCQTLYWDLLGNSVVLAIVPRLDAPPTHKIAYRLDYDQPGNLLTPDRVVGEEVVAFGAMKMNLRLNDGRFEFGLLKTQQVGRTSKHPFAFLFERYPQVNVVLQGEF